MNRRRTTATLVVLALSLALVPVPASGAVPAASVRLLARWRVTKPVAVVNAGDGSGRLFIVEKGGRIRVVKGGLLMATPMLDISSTVSTGSEQGLLGIAFPPGFAAKQYFYVNYTNTAGDTVIARYHMSATPDIATTVGADTILTVHQPAANHNGGNIAFGPDGYLYIGMGDGGPGGDPLGNAQNTNTLLGKMLRIDVEAGVIPYRIPPGNPFASTPGYRAEIWALGFRNPWRFSFDRGTGGLYIGDVGQNAWEEIDFEPPGFAGGRNYGWKTYEGNHEYPPGSTPGPTAGLTFPVYEYSHATGSECVTGGYVYRGSAIPAWQGLYFFGDYVSGAIWAMDTGTYEVGLAVDTPLHITTFGEDEAGELYLGDLTDGMVYQLTDGSVPPSVDLRRIAGADRYATSIAIATEVFPSDTATAVIATGGQFPDALSASALAGAVDGPLLLTPPDRLEARLLTTLTSLGVRDVYVVGGTSAVGANVASGLTSAGYNVTRVAGADRYSTAAEVAKRVKAIEGSAFSGNVFVARGDVFPDALAAAPLAYAGHGPVLLTRPTTLPASIASAIASIGATEAIVLGSTTAVSAGVAAALGVPSTRWDGTDRYTTAMVVANGARGRGWTTYSHVGIATGLAYPDGLTGAVEAGVKGGVLLLTKPDSLPVPTRMALIARKAEILSVTVYGGTPAVSATTFQSLRYYLP